MTIFDFQAPMDRYTFIKIEDHTLRCAGSKVTHATFRNYPVLRIDDLCLEECVFENCHTVYLEDCKVDGCRFSGIDTLYADRTPITNSIFEHLRCDHDCVLCLEDSDVSYCTFTDVGLTNGAHLISGAGDVWVESCCFDNIRTDRKDRALCFCEERVGKIFKKTVQLCIMDEDSCKGLDQIQLANPAEDPRTQILSRAAQKGLLTQAAMEALREEIGQDASKWDAKALGLMLEDLLIRPCVYACLTRAGLRTVGDLARLDLLQILQIKYIEKTVIDEAVTLLHSLGITGSAWELLLQAPKTERR